MDIQQLIRPNIRSLTPYSCARNEFKGEAAIWLDANENQYNSPYNRYHDPLQEEVKAKIAGIKNISSDCIFLGNGSDEPVDLLFRAFCEPRIDNVVAIDPTYGMYRVAAGINDVGYRSVALDENFDFSARRLLRVTDVHTRLVFLCSPNNPTGNSLDPGEIVTLITEFPGLVVLDEAYIDFSAGLSFLPELKKFPNLVILQTFSKAWGSAGVRLGMAFASPEIVCVLNNIKYPYNISRLTQEYVAGLLDRASEVKEWAALLVKERERLAGKLRTLPVVRKVWPSDANFLLIRVTDAPELYHYLVARGIVVRDRHTVTLCSDCLRITVGTPEENDCLADALAGLNVMKR